MKKQIGIIFAVLVIFLLCIFSNSIINFIINVEWYKEVGYLSVYFTQLFATVKLMLPIFVICLFSIWIYYRSIRKSILNWNNFEITKGNKLEKRIFIITDLIISFFVSFSFSSIYWYRILQFENSSNFNVKDPIFNLDVSFYIFRLPLIEELYGVIMSLLVMLVIITLIIYFILYFKDNVTFRNGRVSSYSKLNNFKSGITKFAGRQLAVLAALILLLLSLGYLIKSFDLVYSERGVVFGASYTDIHVSLLFYRIIAVTSLISAFAIFISIIKFKIKPIIASVSVIILLAFLQQITSAVVQNIIVKPNEKTLEAPYINYNIDFTRKAFNIDKVDQKQYAVDDSLTQQDIDENKATIDNIKINSFKPSLEFYNQVQELRYYYSFSDVDVDRYKLNGKLNEVFISPREIDENSLTGNASTWQNRHMNYTHGFGVVMSKVNSITSEGQPDFVMKDIPTKNTTDIKLNNPRIYFGEKTNDYAIVNNKIGEFDYPQSGSDKLYNYNGAAGISANLFNRILFAVNKRDMNFIVSNAISSDSKILINRNILDRVQKIAPFLTYDNDPYCVVYNGRIYWIIDAYTASDRYPFSEPVDNVNYIRNSVKVVVDSYDGTVDFYQVDKNDPIINSYSKIFKGLFKDGDSAPKEIKEHFKYPEDLFNTQCEVLGKYHVTDAAVLYNGTDLWNVSQKQNSQTEDGKSDNGSSYVVMKLPDEKKEEMVLVQYFNMKNKDNMVAIFGARMDGDNYGKLQLYRLPTDKTIYSPYLFKQNVNQDPNISKEVSLWNTQGSQVQYGDTSVIPINNSLLYVEPLYLRAQGKSSIPEVKKIILSCGNKIVMGDDMASALNMLFGYNSGNAQNNTGTSGNTATPENSENIKEAQDIYNKAIDAQKNGDWAKYGEYIKQLGDILNKLNK